MEPVVRNADVTDVALLLHLQRGSVGAVWIIGVRQHGGIMELEQIDVIRLHPPQALFNVGKHRLFVRATALGGDDHILPHIVQRRAQLLLAVRVHVGRVEIVDARLIGPAYQLHRVGLGNALDGQRAEGGLGHIQLRAAQSDFLHTPYPPLPAYAG